MDDRIDGAAFRRRAASVAELVAEKFADHLGAS
jgi:hypothetical protein